MQSKDQWFLLAICLIAVILSGCASATQPVSTEVPLPSPTVGDRAVSNMEIIQVTDGRARTVTVTIPVQRVISLAPSNTEFLFALGAKDLLVGRDSFSDYPAEATSILEVGGGFGDLNTEVILAQNPDLILASQLTPPEQIASLENLGLTVLSLANPKDFEGMYDNLRLVARLTGHQTEADILIEGYKKRVAAVEARTALVKERPLVFYELDGTDPNAPWTSGPGTFIDTMINMAGGENLGSTLGSEWAQISIEELIARNPEVILLGSAHWGGVTPEEVKARVGWGELGAVKNDRLFTFDDNLVSRPGPRLVDGLEAMAKLLHPEVFE
jgi:cobalamin transport system substrate-binding protein